MRKRKIAAALLAAATAGLLGSRAASATTVARWTFESDSIATNNTPAADVGTGTASAIGMATYASTEVGTTDCDVLAGTAGDTGAIPLRTDPGMRAAPVEAKANGWNSTAPIGTQAPCSPPAPLGLPVPSPSKASDWYDTTQGEANLQLEYSTNGGSSWTNLPIVLAGSDSGLAVVTNTGSDANSVTGSYVSDILDVTTNPSGGQDWFTGLTAVITDPAAIEPSRFRV